MRSLKLRNQVLIFFLPMLVLPLLAGAYLSDLAAEDELLAQARRQLTSVANGVLQAIGVAAHRLAQDTSFVSSTPEMNNLLAYQEFEMDREAQATLANLRRFMTDFARTAGDYLQVRYLDSQGLELVRIWHGQARPPRPMPDKGLWERLRLRPGPYRRPDWDQVRVLGVRRLPGSGRLVFSAARLVHGVFQRPGHPGEYTAWGVVILDMDWSRLLGFFHRLPSAQVIILDRRGRLLASPGAGPLLSPRPRQLGLAREILGQSHQAGPAAFTWEGVPYLGALRRVSPAAGLLWTVLVRTELATVMRPAGKVRLVIVGVTLVCLLLAAGGIFYAARIITKPIDRLVEHTQRVAKGDLAARVEEPRIREVALLARSFNRMSQELSSYIEELKRTTAEKERLASEMAIAARLQKSVLPQAPPRLPGWDLAGRTLPARETGGDFFDFLELPAGGLGLVLADVSGKGLPAALFMLSTRAYLRTLALGGLPPQQVLAGANRQVAADSGVSGMFVTTFYAELDPPSGRLRYANAGHNPPLLLRCGQGGAMEELERTGLPLGVRPDESYQLAQVLLRPGDMLLIYSDGVTEAPDREQREWGTSRLREQIRRGSRLPADELLGRIREQVDAWSGSQPQFDDMTLVILARRA